MIRPEYRKTLLEQHGAVVILWVFFLLFIFLYLAIAQFLLAGSRFSGSYSFSAAARVVLWILVAVDLGYLAWWKKNYLAPEVMSDEPGNAKLLRALEGHTTPVEERAAALVSAYVTRKIVLFAIVEAIAVYGLVLALAGRYLWDQYFLSAAAAALLAREFPSRDLLEKLVGEVEARGSGGRS